MQSWQTIYRGLRELPRDISTFELQSFFTYSRAEREFINARRGNAHKLGLALHIGFLRLSGRLLNSVRIVPATLWRHLGDEIGIPALELASLRALYVRGRTLFDHQQLACEVLGFQWMTEHQRRALVRTLRDEVARAYSAFRWSAMPVKSCRHKVKRKPVPMTETDHALTPSNGD